MTCDEAIRELERAALGPRERIGVDDVAAHVGGCAACRDAAADLLLLGAAAAPEAAAPRAPALRVTAASPVRRRAVAAAAVIAMLAVGFVAGRSTASPAPAPPPADGSVVVRVVNDRPVRALPALDPHDYEHGFLAGKSARVYSAE